MGVTPAPRPLIRKDVTHLRCTRRSLMHPETTCHSLKLLLVEHVCGWQRLLRLRSSTARWPISIAGAFVAGQEHDRRRPGTPGAAAVEQAHTTLQPRSTAGGLGLMTGPRSRPPWRARYGRTATSDTVPP